jgi:hypothetical protein
LRRGCSLAAASAAGGAGEASEDEKEEDAGEGELYQFGQECLDRISISLGGNAIVPAAGVLLPAWLQVWEGMWEIGGQGPGADG